MRENILEDRNYRIKTFTLPTSQHVGLISLIKMHFLHFLHSALTTATKHATLTAPTTDTPILHALGISAFLQLTELAWVYLLDVTVGVVSVAV